jgi:hypothetical protein
VSGRHVTGQLKRWAPTAAAAVLAVTPSAAVLLAAGVAGSGYLLDRSDLAAGGTALAAGGLVAERLSGRAARRRMRRLRQESRLRLHEAQQLTADVTRELTAAREALSELTAKVATLQERVTVSEGSAAVRAPVPVAVQGSVRSVGSEPVPFGTVRDQGRPAVLTSARPLASRIAEAQRISPATSAWFDTPPGTTRQPIVSVGDGKSLPSLPVLPPGPREPVSGSIPLLVENGTGRTGTGKLGAGRAAESGGRGNRP